MEVVDIQKMLILDQVEKAHQVKDMMVVLEYKLQLVEVVEQVELEKMLQLHQQMQVMVE